MFWPLFHLENDKIFRRLLPWLGLIFALLPAILTNAILFGVGEEFMQQELLVWPGGIATLLNYAYGYSAGTGYGLYLLLVVAGLTLGQEYAWRTIHLWISHGISRSWLILIKCIVLLLLALIISFAFLITGAIVSIIFAILAGSTIDGNQLHVGQLLLSWLRTTCGMLPYLALSLLVGVLTRSGIAAIGVSFLFMLGIELPLSFILPALGETYSRINAFFPASLASNLSLENMALAGLPVEHTATQPSIPLTLACIALYTIIPIILTLWAIRRQDLTN